MGGGGGSVAWPPDSGSLPRVFAANPRSKEGAGCGYKKSSTFGGCGDDIERNPIASELSTGKGGGCRVGD